MSAGELTPIVEKLRINYRGGQNITCIEKKGVIVPDCVKPSLTELLRMDDFARD